MNNKLKRRLIVVSGIIVIAIIVTLVVVQGNTGSRTISVADAATGSYNGQRVQVSGAVVANSYHTEGNTLFFAIYDQDNPKAQLNVSYDGALSATFGNEVTAICTGTLTALGVLSCTELVTKCPSKYENATDALNVAELLGYGSTVTDMPVKVTGSVKAASLKPAPAVPRFILLDLASADELPVYFDGALADEITANSTLVLTGSLDADGNFKATDVALKQ